MQQTHNSGYTVSFLTIARTTNTRNQYEMKTILKIRYLLLIGQAKNPDMPFSREDYVYLALKNSIWPGRDD